MRRLWGRLGYIASASCCGINCWNGAVRMHNNIAQQYGLCLVWAKTSAVPDPICNVQCAMIGDMTRGTF